MKASIVIGLLLIGTSLFGQTVKTPVQPSIQKYSWEKPHAKVLETGDLQWQPEPFKYIAGAAVRYIDFDDGNDSNDGKTVVHPRL